jgi:IS5 family transposase
MVRQENQQIGFAEAFIRKTFTNTTLDRINNLIDWEPLRKLMETQYTLDGPGRPGYPPVVMLKAVLLQQWYNLSDPALEEAMDDRFSFRRFLGLNLDEKVPDHSTMHVFRSRMEPIIEELFHRINAQLNAQHLMLKKGSLIDATLVESASHPPAPDETSSSDPDATWSKKRGKSYFGHKAHIAIDQGSELIRQVEMTPGNVHDGTLFTAMVSGDEEMVYADKGYSSVERSQWLKERNIEDGIMFQGSKWRSFTLEELERNSRIGQVRKAVEHVFGTFKRIYHFQRCRYFSLVRNRVHLFALCISYNLKRAVKLQAV